MSLSTTEKIKGFLPRSLVLKVKDARDSLRLLKSGKSYKRGFSLAQNRGNVFPAANNSTKPAPPTGNPLWDYFTRNETGPGIWKWHHYFDIYHKHLAKFVGKPVRILEIGIFSGGSLGMWKSYFGPQCHVYGVDIEEVCKVYNSDNVTVFIGDQEDPEFWDRFSAQVPEIDILIDDGGHAPGQQIVTLEKVFPRMSPGGVFICEDVHGLHHKFSEFAAGLVSEMNRTQKKSDGVYAASPFQSFCEAVHFYPFVTVLERTKAPRPEFYLTKKGTQWQPFLEAGGGRRTMSRPTST
jgi:hypothetical protein